jgi:hypothetical protein
MDFDLELNKEIINENAFYRRYSDDIALVCKKDKEEFFKVKIKELLEKEGLEIKDTKTKIKYDGDNFEYLGWEFLPNQTNKRLIKKATITKYHAKMRASIYQEIKSNYHKAKKLKKTRLKIDTKKLYNTYLNENKLNFVSYINNSKIDEKLQIEGQIKNNRKKFFKILKSGCNWYNMKLLKKTY